MQTAYELNPKDLKIRPVAVEPPYAVDANGMIQIEGNPNQVYPVFSDAKKALVELLVQKKNGVQQEINAARKLTRGQINQAAAKEAPATDPAM